MEGLEGESKEYEFNSGASEGLEKGKVKVRGDFCSSFG